MRCPQCGANVRLRVRSPSRRRRRHRAAGQKAVAPTPTIDVELWPVEIFTPSPFRRYGIWVALAVGLAIMTILAYVWFTRY